MVWASTGEGIVKQVSQDVRDCHTVLTRNQFENEQEAVRRRSEESALREKLESALVEMGRAEERSKGEALSAAVEKVLAGPARKGALREALATYKR